MAELIWTIPALNDLETILEYIELDNPLASKKIAIKVFNETERLEVFPRSGGKPQELKGSRYRRLIVGPIKIYHREDNGIVYIVHVERAEMDFDLRRIEDADRS